MYSRIEPDVWCIHKPTCTTVKTVRLAVPGEKIGKIDKHDVFLSPAPTKPHWVLDRPVLIPCKYPDGMKQKVKLSISCEPNLMRIDPDENTFPAITTREPVEA